MDQCERFRIPTSSNGFTSSRHWSNQLRRYGQRWHNGHGIPHMHVQRGLSHKHSLQPANATLYHERWLDCFLRPEDGKMSRCWGFMCSRYRVPLRHISRRLELRKFCCLFRLLGFSDKRFDQAFSRIPISTLLPSKPYLAVNDNAFRGTLPIPLRIGDYNKDGYPDLLVIASTASSAHQGSVALLESIPCSRKTCSQAETEKDRRAFTAVVGDSTTALNTINDAKSAIWLDIDEDGTLDILVQRSGLSSGASRQFKFIRNNYFHDAFFLKTLTSNGACDGVCVTDEGEKFEVSLVLHQVVR